MSEQQTDVRTELAALQTIVEAMQTVDEAAQRRIAEYVTDRYVRNRP